MPGISALWMRPAGKRKIVMSVPAGVPGER